MRILFYRYHSICETDIQKAFDQLGIEVKTLWNDQICEDSEKVSDFLMKNEVNAVFSVNFFPFLSDVCNVFGLIYVSLVVDSPVLELYSKSVSNKVNRFFIFDRKLSEEISHFNDKVWHYPLSGGFYKERLFNQKNAYELKKYRHDIAFVGSLYTEKDPFMELTFTDDYIKGYLEGIMAIQEFAYGAWIIDDAVSDEIVEKTASGSKKFYYGKEGDYLTKRVVLTQLCMGNHVTAMERQDTFEYLSKRFNVSLYTGSNTSKLPKVHAMGLANSTEEMPLIFKESKININTTSKAIRTGLPQRIFDIMSCQGFVLSNYQEEIPEFFEIGQEIEVYTCLEELADKCSFYLEHEKERKEIAQNGYKKVKDKYSYIKKIPEMFVTAFER